MRSRRVTAQRGRKPPHALAEVVEQAITFLVGKGTRSRDNPPRPFEIGKWEFNEKASFTGVSEHRAQRPVDDVPDRFLAQGSLGTQSGTKVLEMIERQFAERYLRH